MGASLGHGQSTDELESKTHTRSHVFPISTPHLPPDHRKKKQCVITNVFSMISSDLKFYFIFNFN